jgi:hypothetical protein
MLDRTKLAVVETYLRRTFPGCQVEEEYEVGKSQYLRIRAGAELRHRILVVHRFLDDHTPEEILTLLTEWRAAEQIRAAGTVLVLITKGGMK